MRVWFASGLALAPATAAENTAQTQADTAVVAQAAQGAPGAAPEGGERAGEAIAPNAPGVETLHVKGRGTGGIQTEVPSSITQFDASTIQALGAKDISDLARVTPNVSIIQPGSTQAIFFIRGIGLSDFSSNAQGAVTVFQDDVSLNAPAIQTGKLFDVEGVEVVRGPQGSGPFRNASAGAIRVRSRRPTGNYNAQLRTTVGRYDADGGKGAYRGLIQDYEGALEVPIVHDLLSSRFAFRLNEAEPYVTNGCGSAPPIALRSAVTLAELSNNKPGIPFPPSICGERSTDQIPPRIGERSRIPVGLPDRVDDKHSWDARGTFALHPADSETTFTLSGHGGRLHQDATLGKAMGTQAVPGSGGLLLGGQVTAPGNAAYWEPDQEAEWFQLCNPTRNSLGQIGKCQNPNAQALLERNLAERRPLDRKPYRGDYDKVGQETRDTWGAFGSAKVGLGEVNPLGDMNLFLLGSYDAYVRVRDQDTDFTPEILFEQVDHDQAWQSYEEVRLAGELSAVPFNWELGGYFLQEQLSVTSNTQLASKNAFFRDYQQRTRSAAGWAGFGWDFLDDFTLEGGVRLNWEQKHFIFTRHITIFDATLPSQTVTQDHAWQTPTGQIILTYHLDESSAVYARYTRGFKAGHFNALASTQNINDPPAKEEYNDAWETGLHASWLNGRVSAQTSFFYYRYENYQVFLFRDLPSNPPVLEIRNAKQAENYGVELEASVAPLRGWTPRFLEGLHLSGTFGWLHGEFLDFQITSLKTQGNTVFPVVTDFSGKPLQNSPAYKVSATAEWTFDLGRYGYLIPRYDLSWQDDIYFDPNQGRGTARFFTPLPRFAAGMPAYFLHGARLAYRTPSSNVELAVWVRNLTDQVYKTYAFDSSNFAGLLLNFVGEPRTMGLDLKIVFY